MRQWNEDSGHLCRERETLAESKLHLRIGGQEHGRSVDTTYGAVNGERMLDFSGVRNYYIRCGYTDMRKQIDGLAALARLEYGMEMTEESLFLFCGTLEGAEAKEPECTIDDLLPWSAPCKTSLRRQNVERLRKKQHSMLNDTM